MGKISLERAARLAKDAPRGMRASGHVCQDSIMRVEMDVTAADAGTRGVRPRRMVALLFEPTPLGGAPRPVPAPDGRHALSFPCEAVPDAGSDAAHVVVDAIVPGRAGEDVEVVVVPRRRGALPPAIGSVALAGAAAALLALGSWGDPTARRGYYEGKSTEEIRADLDAEVAWNSMEISVASRMRVAEGETRVEARIENVEANHCDQKVRIFETGAEGDVLFESGAIAPGEYLHWVELAHALPVGEHRLTVEFQGYEQAPTLLSDEGVVLGHDTFGASCAAEVVLEVVPAG